MVYCHECGEQVAENDIFCPFCGISLSPISLSGAETDDSQSNTVPVEPPPIQPFSATVENAPADSSAPLTAQPAIRERLGIDKSDTGNISDEVTFSDAEIKNDAGDNPAENNENEAADSDIPAPQILNDASLTLSETPPQPVAASPYAAPSAGSDSGKFSFNEAAGLADEKTEGNIEIPAEDLQTESALMDYDEAEIKEVLSAEEPEKSVEDIFPAAIVEVETKESESTALTDESAFNDLSLENINFDDDYLPEPKSAENAASASEAISPPPIVMPEIELPLVDSFPPSRFDSVNIMEKKADEVAPPQPTPAENPIPAASKAAEPLEKSNEAASYTAPIANNDTGGRNKAKLKPLDEGTVLNGRYEIIRKIGGGGMGAVYLASDKNLGGVLRAVKEMVQSYIEDAQQEKAVNDFKRESLLLTSLDHQSIPTIYDYFFDEKEARFYLVMKYISGGDLAGRLRSAPESRIDEASVTQWAIQIADVLDYLHNRQPPIVYRDLKPANIMIDGNSGRVMLIDFGIARWVNKEEKGVTAVGTMGYAPPELFSGNVEARSDIYSLGSTMFHLLTGADPQSNPLLIFDFQKHPRPRQINPQLSDQMERILMRAVEYNADKRFASAAELKKSLEEHLENTKTGRATFGVKEAPLSIALSDQPVFCGFCGQKIVATDMFCAFCGSKQPLAQQGVHSASYSPVPLTAQLLIIGTNDLEQPAFRLEKEDNLVGRRDPMSNIFPEVDLSKFDPQTKISRRHARIWREGSEFMVEDLGSSNGTYILPVISDSMRLQPHQPQLLTNGDKIRLGDTTLHFILG